MTFFVKLFQDNIVNVLQFLPVGELDKLVSAFPSAEHRALILTTIRYIDVNSVGYETLWLLKHNLRIKQVKLSLPMTTWVDNAGSFLKGKIQYFSELQLVQILNMFQHLESIVLDSNIKFSLESWLKLSPQCLMHVSEISYMFERHVEVELVERFIHYIAQHCQHLKKLQLRSDSSSHSSRSMGGTALETCQLVLKSIPSIINFECAFQDPRYAHSHIKTFHYLLNTGNHKNSIMIGCNCNHSQDDSELVSFFSECGNFSEIALRHFSFQLSDQLMDSIVTNNPQLESFQYDFSYFNEDYHTIDSLLHLLRTAKHLRKLTLLCMSWFHDKELALLTEAELPGNLKVLEFSMCGGVDTNQVVCAAVLNKTVDHMVVKNCKRVDLAAAQEFFLKLEKDTGKMITFCGR